LLVVVVILAVYRQLDRNNRSLEKVKRFVERVQGEMDEIVAEKVTMLKDIGIEVDVHQKAAKEVLKRINSIEEDLNSRTDSLEAIGTRLTDYEQALDQLMNLTQRTEENISRVRDESEYVDKVGKRIKATQAKIDELEQALPGIVAGFEKQNADRLSEVETSLFEKVQERVAALQERVDGAGSRVQEFSEEVARLQNETDEQSRDARAALETLHEQLSASTREETADVVRGAREELEENREQVEEFRRETELRFEELRTDVQQVFDDVQEQLDALGEQGRSMETEALTALRSYIDAETESTRNHLTAQLEGVRSQAGQLTEDALHTVHEDVQRQVQEHRTQLEQSIVDLESTTQDDQEEIRRRFTSLRAEVDEWMEKNRQTAIELEQQVEALQEENRTREEERTRLIEQRSAEAAEFLENHRSDLEGRMRRVEESLSTALSELQSRLEHDVETAAGQVESHQLRMSEEFAALKQRFEHDIADMQTLGSSTSSQIEELQGRLSQDVQSLGQRITTMTDDLGVRIDSQAHDMEQSVLGDLEARLSDYEKELNYRFTKVETVSADIEALEHNLRLTMDRISERVRGDFLAFGEEIRGQREEDRQEAEAAMQILRDSMTELESGLNELKQRAYDSVSEKLKVFEDEFFADLRDRSSAMDARIDEWRTEVAQRLEAMHSEHEQERAGLEKEYGESLRQRLHSFQDTVNGQLSKLDESIGSFRNGIESRIEASEEHLSSVEVSLKDEVESLGERSRQNFRQEFSQADERIRSEMKEFEAGVYEQVEEIRRQAEHGRSQVEEMVEASRSDVAVWQTEVLNQLRSNNADVSNQLADAKVRLSENLQELKREFAQEKEELVEESLAERQRVHADIESLGGGVRRLESDLQERSQAALDDFQNRFSQLQKRADEHERDMTDRLEERSEEFRSLIANTRDQFQAMRDKLIGKLEEEASTLGTTLQEIDKRQKAFVEQTKIFERADTLKVTLQQNIEDLKGDIARVEGMRGEVREIEGQFAKIRKMSADAGEKMARFNADKRRIDLLEEDYKRLIGLAQSVEDKIAHVGNSDDQLQEITARLKSLDELQSEVEARFDRLEKRRGLIDQTSDGLERNSQAVASIEQEIETLSSRLEAMPQQVNELSKELQQVAAHRKETKAAVEQLAKLDETLSDVEHRMKELQTAREWLARTETRLEEIRRDAGEQVKLLGSIMREDAKKNPDGSGGAPSLSARETVQKLAHQGWKVDEIARATKVSRGEVELILELTGKR
ncbi:MAG: SpiroCoCo family coiled-coil protein, partial [Alkalispirochaeta sp.]